MWEASGLAARDWRLQLAGDGAERDALVRLAEALQISESVDFLGARSDVAALMAQASIFLATRPDEPFGLSVVEAMAAGLPVVAARGGGHDETVGRCADAVMFDGADPLAAGALLGELALDESRRVAYGEQLRDGQRSRFTLERQASMMIEQYRLLTDG